MRWKRKAKEIQRKHNKRTTRKHGKEGGIERRHLTVISFPLILFVPSFIWIPVSERKGDNLTLSFTDHCFLSFL